jgi:hypothetical protein
MSDLMKRSVAALHSLRRRAFAEASIADVAEFGIAEGEIVELEIRDAGCEPQTSGAQPLSS